MKPQSPQPHKPYPIWIYVFEVTASSMSRRSPHKPHVLVAKRRTRPDADAIARIARGRADKRHGIVRVLTEAMPADHEPGGLDKPFEYPRDAMRIKEAMRLLRQTLRCEGYTFGGESRVWHVYAIELADDHITEKPPGYRGHVYVGQTSHDVDERMKQHRLGQAYDWKRTPKHGRYCHKYFRRPAPELVPAELRGPIFCLDRALEAERDLRRHLEGRGYRVEGGTELLPKKKPKKKAP